MHIRTVLQFCITFLGALLLQACGLLSSGPDYSAWEGHSIKELTEVWGEPENINALSADTSAMTWSDEKADCQVTFFTRDGRISGYSDTGC